MQAIIFRTLQPCEACVGVYLASCSTRPRMRLLAGPNLEVQDQ